MVSVPPQMIDTHLHLWKPSERRYEWLDAAGPPLNADFGPEDVEADIASAGVTGVVLVQAADSYEDTLYMLSVAATHHIVCGVVAWAPLNRPAEAAAAINLYAATPVIRGIRVLSHIYDDPRWLLSDDVDGSLALLAPLGLTLDVACALPQHLAAVCELADRHPELNVVVNHLATPPIADGGWEPWASLLAEVAIRHNVSVKLSGLATQSAPGWAWQHWVPYVDHAIALFGSARLMMGSDWPVSTLSGDFGSVWQAQRDVIARLNVEQQNDILFRTAMRFYSLNVD